MDINKHNLKNIEEQLKIHDVEHNYSSYSKNDSAYEKEFLIDLIKINEKSVLGIDIYQYSQFEEPQQNYIPVIFKLLMEATNLNIVKYDYVLFQKYIVNSKLELNFIDSGDGGFYIFDNPLLSLAYAIHFQNTLTGYNTYHFYRKLRLSVGEINLRYSITYDSLFQMDNNFYGASIINNARILSKDKLNRCLIDDKTYNWFLKYFNSIEQLTNISDIDLQKVEVFKDYNFKNIRNIQFSALSKNGDAGVQIYGIKNIYSQKVGVIKSKNQYFSIYNVYVTFIYGIHNEEGTEHQNITSTLGNLNTSGLNVE
ncbi:hypothetical protein [Leptospira adleri]|uniref:Uncharacterized protein n=1 Tax=Leptospira adleri TaxID=2023186 RepID=A0ABX4NVB9_9LEPT|nr:hypothetical protein [Leptospira adleri]PJZ59562.1 hypothetical protein CH376_23110 [Leptospira adleri]